MVHLILQKSQSQIARCFCTNDMHGRRRRCLYLFHMLVPEVGHAVYGTCNADSRDVVVSRMEEEEKETSLCPYSQQRPMRTNPSCRLGLIDNGQHKSTNRLLDLVPHERPHGIMRILDHLYMLLPKALNMRAIKDTMALVANSIGGTKCAPAQMSWHLRHLNPALLNRQGMSTHPKMENGSELCHWDVYPM